MLTWNLRAELQVNILHPMDSGNPAIVNIIFSSKARLQDISLRVFIFKCNLKSFKMTCPEMTNAVGKVSKCGNPVKMCSM